MFLNISLRVLSVLVLLLILHQRFFGMGGSDRHRSMGVVTMLVGVALVGVVYARALAQEGPMTLLYAIHLVVGGLFFIDLFATGVYGWLGWEDGNYSATHVRLAGWVTPLLVATVALGIVSLFSH